MACFASSPVDRSDSRPEGARQRIGRSARRLVAAAVVLSAGLAAGCQSPPPPRRIYVRIDVLVTEHPSWRQLAALRRAIASPPAKRPAPPEPLPAATLPPAPTPDDPALPDTAALVAAARDRTRRERPDEAALVSEEIAVAQLEALSRLQDEIRNARERLLAEQLDEYIRAVRVVADEIGQLRVRVWLLRPDPENDPLVYSPDQLRRRALLYQGLREDLAQLESQRRQELLALLERQRQTLAHRSRLPRESFEAEWERRRAERLADIERRIAAEEARLRGSIPQPEALPSLAGEPITPGEEERRRLETALALEASTAARDLARRETEQARAAERLRRAESRLREQIRAEVEAVVRALAREQGMEPVFDRAGAQGLPDRTEWLRSLLRAHYAGAIDSR